MFCLISWPICSLILTILYHGQLIEAENMDKNTVINHLKEQPTSQPPHPSSSASICSFQIRNDQLLCPVIDNFNPLLGFSSWKFGVGKKFALNGGPASDANNFTDKNGYIYANMKDSICQTRSAITTTKLMPQTEESGKCLQFQYSIEGRSVKQFMVVIMFPTISGNSSRESCQNNPGNLNYSNIHLWSTIDTTSGRWKTKNITYSSQYEYTLGFIAIPTARFIEDNSYVAIDNIEITDGPCGNDCTFNEYFCMWENSNETEIQWILSTRMLNSVGASTAHRTSVGLAYIENVFKQRIPGDKARLISKKTFADYKMPICMRFWAFLGGRHIATLRILMRNMLGHDTEIWIETAFEEKFDWHPYQVTLSHSIINYTNDNNFRVIIEAEIIQYGQGEIGIDSVIFEDGSCPTEPHRASILNTFGCSFMTRFSCPWEMIQPNKFDTTPMIRLVAANGDRPDGHSWNPRNEEDNYIQFDLSRNEHQAGDSAFLVSSKFYKKYRDCCLSFWYMIYTDDGIYRSIGSLSIILATRDRKTTIWKVRNIEQSRWARAQVPIDIFGDPDFQLMFKATKGSIKDGVIAIDDISFYYSKCQYEPELSETTILDCDFSDDDLCLWKVKDTTNTEYPLQNWRNTGEHSIDTGLSDHTYEIPNRSFGYTYSKSSQQIFSRSLISQSFTSSSVKCFTFFFIDGYADDTATLTVYRLDEIKKITIMIITSQYLMTKPGNNIGKWIYVQFQLPIDTSFQIIFEARMQYGGWGIDDIQVKDGGCRSVLQLQQEQGGLPTAHSTTPQTPSIP